MSYNCSLFSLDNTGFRKNSGFQRQRIERETGERKDRGRRQRINLDLVCILLFRTLCTGIIYFAYFIVGQLVSPGYGLTQVVFIYGLSHHQDFFFTNKKEGNSNKLVNRKHAEVDNKYYIFNQLDQKAHQRGFFSGVLRFPPVSSNYIFMEVLPMKKKWKKFKLFDIQTGLVLVINEETRRTKKHSETCEIVALGRECKIKVNKLLMLKISNKYQRALDSETRTTTGARFFNTKY